MLISNIISKDPIRFGKEIFSVNLEKARFYSFGKFNNKTSDILSWYYKGSKAVKNYDVVILNGIVPISHKRKVGIIHHLSPNLKSMKFLIYKFLYNNNKINVCVSNKVRYEAVKKGINCDHVVNPPIKSELFSINNCKDKNEKFILHTGADYRKHPEVSYEAVKILNEKFNLQIKLKIVLNWPIDKTFSDIETKCCISLKELLDLYCNSYLLLAPYEYEGFAYTIAEAQNFVPVIAGPGIPDDAYIDGLTGIKVNTLDPLDYANEIYNLIKNEKLYNLMKANAMIFSKRFDIDNIGEKFESILNSII
ncbi:glycosyltransferase [Caldisphaera lagunensis DSM 15908]|uniref:Glycosyltransferase n=1 Tax=Caldisphaera lagunensis (strain DSM 15908 / JCM 11604 / ANMR 0165 / IC-154) TaxID=1056495 RepID=L0A9X7_CALLD|nr:glycosyltransferase [Caldisphaera lagunensis]AFZ70656.1 glycosyltransferase [Caldisphaera lagunensis DSM 15908]